jgi:hypothetical protein
MTPPSDVPPKELNPTASDDFVETATEEDAGGELDVIVGVLRPTLVVGAEVFAVPVPALTPVLTVEFLLDTTVTLAVVVALFECATDEPPVAVLDAAVSDCAEPVPVPSWKGRW